jgi:hypothetical protein
VSFKNLLLALAINKPCFSTNLVTGSTRPVIPLTIGSIALPATMVSLDGGRTWGTHEEGIYIDTMICSKPISMLVDTGASVTILSQTFLNPIDPSLKPEIIILIFKTRYLITSVLNTAFA